MQGERSARRGRSDRVDDHAGSGVECFRRPGALMGTLSDGETIPTGDRVSDVFGLVGTRLDGKYDIEAVVAEGGFGVVYRGVHRGLHKPVAVKVLKVPEDLAGPTRKAFLEKFSEEARTVARLEHPAIVRVIDFGASPMPRGESAPWMVLDWLQGTTLEDDIAARGGGNGRSPAEALALLRPAFEALSHAHDEGVVHRDVKPGNMMLVSNRRGEISLRLLDFGIAKLVDGEGERTSGMTATRSALKAFSPHYAAPEQISGTRTGPWTDVHALALVVVEVLTGRAPYAQHDMTALYADVLSSTRPTPAKFGVDVGAWEPVLAKALSLMPSDRYADARALLSALAVALPGVRYSYTPGSTRVNEGLRVGVSTTLRPQTLQTGAAPGAKRWMYGLGAAVVIVVVGIVGLRAVSGGPAAAMSASSPVSVAAQPALPPPAPSAAVVAPPAEPSVVIIPSVVDAGSAVEATAPSAPPRAAPPRVGGGRRPAARAARTVVTAPVVTSPEAPPAAPRPREILVE